MKKILMILILISTFLSINIVHAFFNASHTFENEFDSRNYNITLNSENCTYSSDSIIIKNNETTLPTPTRDGYTFLGYGTSPTSGVDYSKNITNVGSINNVELYPKWDVITYYINYNYNGGYASNPTSYTIESNTFTISNPTRTGYYFDGWYGTGLSGYPTTITIPKGSTGDRSYTATWEARTYYISYDLNGGTVSPANKTSYKITTSTFTLNNPTKDGYTFLGWTGSNGSTPSTNVTISRGSTGSKSYTANWSSDSYSISYNLNGGTLSNKPTSYTIDSDTFTLPQPSRDGYTFDGWTGSNGSTPQKSVTISNGSTGNLSYTANWTASSYTITYYDANGSYYDTRTINSTDSIPNLSYSTDQLHVFEGWYTSGGTKINNVGTLSSNLSVYAHVRETYCVVYTGEILDGDMTRLTRYEELLTNVGLKGGSALTSTNHYYYISGTSTYSNVLNGANYLMNNAPSGSWPYLRWVAIQCAETGYDAQLR